MNRPLISLTSIICSQNIQVSTNITGVPLVPKTDFTKSENDNFHSNNHPKFLAKEEQNQDIDSDATLGVPKNSGKTSDKVISLNNNNELRMRSAKDLDFDDEDNYKNLMLLSEKAK